MSKIRSQSVHFNTPQKNLKKSLNDSCIDFRTPQIDKKSMKVNPETCIENLKNQHFEYYQHNDGTCACGLCLCGKCKCKKKGTKVDYPKDLRSQYQREFPWKNPSEKDNYQIKSYKPISEYLNKESTYLDHYKPFHVLPTKPIQEEQLKHNQFLFSSTTQYQRDYKQANAFPTFSMKPLNQYFNPKDLNYQYNTTYRTDYKGPYDFPSEQFNFAKDNSAKLHTGNIPNLFMQTTYNQFYKGKKGEQTKGMPQKATLMPFGLNGEATSQFKTNNQKEYVMMEIQKCPARVLLEDLSTKLVEN